MKRVAHENWPPLIIASEKPRWVIWRDFVLTLAMWLVLAIMLATEFELFFGRYLERLGLGTFNTDAQWGRFFRLLEPYIWLTVAMFALLAATTMATLHRMQRFLKTVPPPALAPAEEAAHGRIGLADLLAARDLRNVVVHVEADGSRRVELRQATPE